MRRRQGFTLIELSIVIVIIGLIVGGVLVGRDMVRAAELRKNHKQYESYIAAINTFRTKYNCMPGDCPNATTFFGDLGTCPDLVGGGFSQASPAMIAKDDFEPLTCNGDGDRRIDAGVTLYEMNTVWQHLSAANIIDGSFTGGFLSGPSVWESGKNCPASAAHQLFCWWLIDGDNSSLFVYTTLVSVSIVPGRVGTILWMTDVAETNIYAFSPAEAFSYDGKYDDGNPVTGTIQVARKDPGDTSVCTDGDETIQDASNRNAKYRADHKESGCYLFYKTGM